MRADIDPRAMGYYGLPLETALQIAREKIEEWDYESDKHGYCHDRSVLLALVNAIEGQV